MKKLLSNKLFYVALSLILLGFYSGQKYQINNDMKKIIDVQATHDDKNLYLDVYLSQPLSCKKIVKLLDIKPFDVKSTTYFPTCDSIDAGLTRITYKQTYAI